MAAAWALWLDAREKKNDKIVWPAPACEGVNLREMNV